QTKGRVESGIKYVRGNFWPGARFVDDAGLNEQARAWVAGVPNPRLHGTPHERPADRLGVRQPTVPPPPERSRRARLLRETGGVRPVGARLVRGELEARGADRRGAGRRRDGPALGRERAAGGPSSGDPARATPDHARPVGRAADGRRASTPRGAGVPGPDRRG